MKTILKYILLIILTFVAFNWANEIPRRYVEKVNQYISAYPECFNYESSTIHSHKLPVRPDAELGSIGLTINFHADSKFVWSLYPNQFTSLKSITRQLCEHQDNLFIQREKEHDTSILTASHPVSDYYIFGLRHIII